MAIRTEVIAEALDLIGQDRTTFNDPDQILAEIIEVESLRLAEAAKTLGREWNGTFNRGHILLIARTYHNLAQVAKFRRVPTPTRIETSHYYAEPLGASWIVRDKARGEVACSRPSDVEAEKAMEAMESRGTFTNG